MDIGDIMDILDIDNRHGEMLPLVLCFPASTGRAGKLSKPNAGCKTMQYGTHQLHRQRLTVSDVYIEYTLLREDFS